MHQGNQNEVASSVLEEGRELMPASRLVHPDTSSMLLTLPCWERKSREKGEDSQNTFESGDCVL